MAKIYGIGMGPGDPELITMKGFKILEQCKVIAYPAPPDKKSFVREIAARWLDEMLPKQEIIIPIPLSIENRDTSMYEIGADKIIEAINRGDDVAILCEGDPFLYGSFIYLFDILSEKLSNIEIEIIPGISSVMASSARIMRPLAEKSEPLLILPALKIDERLKQYLQTFPAIALMKIGKRFSALKKLLEELELINEAFYIEYATLEKEKIRPLSEINLLEVPYFSIILIRKTQPYHKGQ